METKEEPAKIAIPQELPAATYPRPPVMFEIEFLDKVFPVQGVMYPTII
jgi:hypothetical protein